jgi:hypothetical protein
MRIENIRSEKKEAKARITATVTWEDSDRPTREIYFETDEGFAQDLSCNPHSFLVGCIMPAMRHGEERIAIDETICPEVRNGLETAMGWICEWYGPPRKPVRIEAKPGVRPPLPRTGERAGSFLSGGLDSLAILRANRLDFPLDHPRSIKDCLVVYGFDIGGLAAGSGQDFETFERAMATLPAVAEDAQVTLIPVFTNVRHLEDDVYFWMYEFHAAALASVAHAFARRLTCMSISSTIGIEKQHAWGSHPVLDPNYSSTDLQVRHEGVRLSRLDKAKLVAGWDVAVQNLRVCWTNPPGMLNCGKCEKCVRTMTELLIAGKLSHTRAFPADDVSSEMIESVTSAAKYIDAQWRDLIEPLTQMGRLDLVKAIEKQSAKFHRQLAWEEERDWKGAVKRFDRRYFRSILFQSYRALRACVVKA